MKTILQEGFLEIDVQRGVIYFHSKEGVTLLRICRLPRPLKMDVGDQLDLTLNESIGMTITRP